MLCIFILAQDRIKIKRKKTILPSLNGYIEASICIGSFCIKEMNEYHHSWIWVIFLHQDLLGEV